MRSFALLLAFAVPAAAASAAPTANLAPYTASKTLAPAAHSAYVRMTFRNTSVAGRVLTIGDQAVLLPAFQTVDMSVKTGSTVHVSSPWNTRVNSDLLVVTASDAHRTVTLQ